ncbi:Aspartyl protease [Mucilaginibacter mallensis]|uniref:Aspartyl protease n=1 Tax=Mucilaginibacter mallensis TaxID=652787 RepID=A0A1H2BSQ4_MUCMA|nr:retropepsin-like aspartic protease [Mucilaginibacter mallensis]SDT61154.1 Aspartyl protease [Mucilaginibacter mallensis]
MKNLILALLLITISLQLHAQNKPIATLPFELKSDNRIYIKCRVNQSDTLTFLFDTGAGAMVINESILGKKLNLVLDSTANNMGSNGESKVKKSTHNKLSFGNIDIDSVTYLAIPYGDAPFDGVFGNNLMKKYVIEINYHKKRIYFYNSKDYVLSAKAYDKFQLKFTLDVPTIDASLFIDSAQIKGTFEMDTGGDSGLIISDYFSKNNHIAQKLKQVATAESTGSDGVKTGVSIVIMPEVTLGTKSFYRIPALLSGAQSGVLGSQQLAGIFGNAFLKRFDMILDLQHNQLFLKPNDYLYTPYYEFLVK